MSTNTVSKSMAFILRHHPEQLDLTVDAQGWVFIVNLAAALTKQLKFSVTSAMVAEIVSSDLKQRFIINGTKIRAAQGHSFTVELGYIPVIPPVVLFHGTAQQSVAAILVEGLKPMSRQQVHMSAEQTTAITVGSRHGIPVVLQIAAQQAHLAGIQFIQASNGVWLTSYIPAEFITKIA